MLLAGLRKGEAMALSWDDVNFEKNTIFVNKSIYEIEGNSYFKDPKTENSKRIITVPNYLIEN